MFIFSSVTERWRTTMISAIFFALCFILLSPSLHTGPAEDMQLYPQKSFWVFLLSDGAQTNKELFIPKNLMIFVYLILTVFGGKMIKGKF